MVEYLSSAPEITKHVAAGLADIAQLKAADPIAQLGQYLIKLADNLERSKAVRGISVRLRRLKKY